MASKKFFEDNIERISPQGDPVAHNTNAGLLAMSQELAKLLAQQDQIQRTLAQLVQQFRSR